MNARVIDGKQIATSINAETKASVIALNEKGITPGLAVVLVGDRPDSELYVAKKVETCAALGIYSQKVHLPATTSQLELLTLIDRLNNDPKIHGILVQSPPPKHIDESAIVHVLNPAKDVDGFHPINVGKLAMGDPTGLVPCTPSGCQELLLRSGIQTQGAHVVVVGRSMIVGKPVALLLMAAGPGGDATVTVCHSKTRHLNEITRQADILIVAMGKPQFIGKEMVKEGAVVIDVGIHVINDPTRKSGKRTVGDVAFEEVSQVASHITPVPGGVGPMTIALLMRNTVKACRQAAAL
ncbi:MAG: tetrahydrofolate dehydrogenase/cyclohydrolase catalytic domain-containing protein [Verrucomicrobiota bacterium]|nr:tetrahydrofolate dehydrogenase/cyclohydrolase catalytic domain-containing protein [Verrucomicrobiota bacterium]